MRFSPGRLKAERRASAGFSLLEVLVAMVVFAIGVTGMLTALGHNLRDINYTKDHAQAVRVAAREMDALRRLTYRPDAEHSGDEGRFSWRAEVYPLEIDDLPGMNSDDEGRSDAPIPCEIDVTVSWRDDVGGEPVHRVKLNGLELYEDE